MKVGSDALESRSSLNVVCQTTTSVPKYDIIITYRPNDGCSWIVSIEKAGNYNERQKSGYPHV